jgi:hypothetical protein
MTPPLVLTLLGVGLGVLIVASGPSSPRAGATTLRDRVIEAQRISAIASLRARELAAQWSAGERR